MVKKYFTGSEVKTCFDRTIPCDSHHALNYIIQSTTSDLLLKQMVKVDKILEGTKSFIAFPLHDSLVIDLSLADRGMVKELVDIFKETELGTFRTNLSIGRNFGEMKKYEV